MIEFCQFNEAPSQAMGDDFSLNGSLGSRALSTSRTGFALVYQSDIRLNGSESCWSLATLRPVPHGRPAVSLYLDADCRSALPRSPEARNARQISAELCRADRSSVAGKIAIGCRPSSSLGKCAATSGTLKANTVHLMSSPSARDKNWGLVFQERAAIQ